MINYQAEIVGINKHVPYITVIVNKTRETSLVGNFFLGIKKYIYFHEDEFQHRLSHST